MSIRKQKKNERTCIVVLGMHRSGTSAFTRVLSLLGCDLPKTLMRPNEYNESGYWESSLVCKLNDRLLESAGYSWFDYLPFHDGWYESPIAQEFRDEALTVLREEFGKSRLFVLKDPRICRIAPFWLDVFGEFGATPRFIIPLRNPIEVAASLEKRDHLDLKLAHFLWLGHVLDAEKFSRGKPRLHCSYEDLLARGSQVIAADQETFGITWPKMPSRIVSDTTEFLSEEHRHYAEKAESVLENPTLPKWVCDTYRIFLRWSAQGEDPADFKVLDAIRSEFNSAGSAFFDLVENGRRAASSIQQLEVSLTKNQAALADLEATVAKKEEMATTQKQAADNAEAALKEMAHKVAQTESALVQRRHEAEQTAAELQSTLSRYAELEHSVDNANREREKAETNLVDRFEEIASLLKVLRDSEEAAEAKLRRQEEEAEAKLRRQEEAAFEVRRELAAETSRLIGRLLESGTYSVLPARIRLWRRMRMLRRSGLIDRDWYLRHYTDVENSGMDPLYHFVRYGAAEGRAPNESLLGDSVSQRPVGIGTKR